jgi:hypothetical protein
MLYDPWIPVLLGFAVFLLGSVSTLVILPETLPRQSTSQNALAAHTAAESHALDPRDLKERLRIALSRFRHDLNSIFAINGVGFLLFSFFAVTVGTIAGVFELQYTHKRFGWSYSFVRLTIEATSYSVSLLELISISIGGIYAIYTAVRYPRRALGYHSYN